MSELAPSLTPPAPSKDPTHWLFRLDPLEWVRASIHELEQAEQAFALHRTRAGDIGCRRAAGMALNAILSLHPELPWGRSYLEHVEAVSKDDSLPEAMVKACQLLATKDERGTTLVTLRSPKHTGRMLEAARAVMTHAYEVVRREVRVTETREGEGGHA